MTNPRRVDDLLAEADRHPVEGWDFEWLIRAERMEETALPWDYARLVHRTAATSADLLDLGTGGGERLAELRPHPRRTVATESYPPNVPVAARRLTPLGIQVVRSSGASDNVRQRDDDPHGALPFRNGSFHLVIDRNEAFRASEVARVLTRGGTFLTEQSGSQEIVEFSRWLGQPNPEPHGPRWNLAFATAQLVGAGLAVMESRAGRISTTFHDVGAISWYLRMVPWAMPGFSVDRYRAQLVRLQGQIERTGPVRLSREVFWLRAEKT